MSVFLDPSGADWDWVRDSRIRLLSGRGSVHSGAYTTDGRAIRYCDSRWSGSGEWETTEDPLSCRKCLHLDAARALRGLDPLDEDDELDTDSGRA